MSVEWNRRALQFLLVGALAAGCVAWAGAGRAAQNDGQQTRLRTVHGEALDKQGNAVDSAVVYLENMKTQEVRTYITANDGTYHFSGLDPNVDYQIHAEKGEMMSSTRTVSSYDSRRDMEFILRLTHKKAEKPPAPAHP